ncbi:MAG TPA: hypothetical protein PKC76_13665 [Saprospiraceae bacterium]|nr:hypothetical protein [Saprospiraceae bacterium]HMP25182.1 hypothetical protein [Saprospiraceae bacterium]
MTPVITRPLPTAAPTPRPKQDFRWWCLLFSAIGGILYIVAQWQETDFLTADAEGNPVLSEERQRKLARALQELDEAEQYALLATRNGHYPCFSCVDSTHIFLYQGEVWKYGVTTKGEKGRYGSALSSNYLTYYVQYQGDLTTCKKQELLKIYHYAKLPENLKRSPLLIRPPGNKIDQ